MKSTISFQGPGPFHLPTAQRATAVGHSKNGVTMTIYCQLPAHERNEPEPVNVQMVSSVARELATKLLRAANEADAGPPQGSPTFA